MTTHFITNIEKKTLQNKNYRKVVHTDTYQQIVLMSLNVGEYIHCEKHSGTQFFRIEHGTGLAVVGNKKLQLADGIALSVLPNICHKIINTSKKEPLKIYTIYSPPQHKPNEICKRQPKEDK
jgi:mannose-6-phosphate isomerase-like protein (cupin superfamily)